MNLIPQKPRYVSLQRGLERKEGVGRFEALKQLNNSLASRNPEICLMELDRCRENGKTLPFYRTSLEPGCEIALRVVSSSQPQVNFSTEGNEIQLLLQNGYFYHTAADGKSVEFANFTLEVVEKIVKHVSREQVQNYYQLNIIFPNRTKTLRVPMEKYKGLKEYLKKYLPEAHLGITNQVLFEKYLTERLNDADLMPVRHEFSFSGWYENGCGEFTYLHDGLGCVDSGKCLVLNYCEGDIRRFLDIYFSIGKVNIQSQLAVILLYCMYGFAAVFFEASNSVALNSTLYLSAPTNTGKTSFIKVLAGIFVTDCDKKYGSFDDTDASLEELIRFYNDDVLLIDDRRTGLSAQKETAFRRKTELIARAIGDGHLRNKLDNGQKLRKDIRYRGGVILTGEFMDFGDCESSMLRMLYVELPKNVIDFTKLKILQSDKALAAKYFSAFIRWLEVEQNIILSQLPNMVENNRESAQNYLGEAYARQYSVAAALMTMADLFEMFVISKDIESCYYGNLKEHVIQIIKANMALATTVSPINLWKQAVSEAVLDGALKVADSYDSFLNDLSFDGYREGNFLKLMARKVEKVFKNYAQVYHMIYNKKTFDKVLLKEGVILQHTQRIRSTPGKQRYDGSRPPLYTVVENKLFREEEI